LSDAETAKQAKPPPKVRRRAESPEKAAKAADLNSIQTGPSDAPPKARLDSLGLDLSGISRAPKLDRAGLLWDRAVRTNRNLLAHNELSKNKLLGSQVCAVFLAGRDQRDAPELPRDLAELPFEYARSNDPWRDRAVVGFAIDPKGPSGHSARQYTEALKGLQIAAREIEDARKAEIPQDENGFAEVRRIFDEEGGIAKLAELGRKGKRGDDDDESQHLIDLNRRRVEKHRAEAGLAALKQGRHSSASIVFAEEGEAGLVKLGSARLYTLTNPLIFSRWHRRRERRFRRGFGSIRAGASRWARRVNEVGVWAKCDRSSASCMGLTCMPNGSTPWPAPRLGRWRRHRSLWR
jgi:hypothetical protein